MMINLEDKYNIGIDNGGAKCAFVFNLRLNTRQKTNIINHKIMSKNIFLVCFFYSSGC